MNGRNKELISWSMSSALMIEQIIELIPGLIELVSVVNGQVIELISWLLRLVSG